MSWHITPHLLERINLVLPHVFLVTRYFLITNNKSTFFILYNGHVLIIMMHAVSNALKDNTFVKLLRPVFLKVDTVLG